MTCQRTQQALKRLMVVGSVATGYLMCDLADMHTYLGELMGKPEWVIDSGASGAFSMDLFKQAARPDFIAAIKEAQDLL